ncbi:DUF6431 domain-containing protein [Candidatus Mycobacterium methanotrophicum]|uniref:DUF6431 domain-containing protein n=1 Tax=Candidatus Mycobacterium methanotrophicum TaxID=2943498 RepID=A0ABY4QG44_9MYCO|nr:DUF6431 domain-containing protein [Candidatus Mycobacterium methanotrophicum]UQX09452.1 DUF6431 domain-containing protein [Candidatus Mycobacterium methanotrophicum]
MIVTRTAELAEDHLNAGTLHCPRCAGRLAKWGFGRRRTIRSHGTATVTLRPRRVRCPDCESTHIVLPAAFQARHADTTAVIGQALLHEVNGLGYRRMQLNRCVRLRVARPAFSCSHERKTWRFTHCISGGGRSRRSPATPAGTAERSAITSRG